MRIRLADAAAAIAATFLVSQLADPLAGQPQPASRVLALSGGTIYVDPDAVPLRDGLVLVRDGRIAAVGTRLTVPVPDGAEVLDCAGMTVTAGFWNSHVHFMERKWANAASIPAPELDAQLQDMLTRYGFTTVFDTGSPWENTRLLRDSIESGRVPGPRIRSTGETIVPQGGSAPDLVMDVKGAMRVTTPEAGNAAEALAAATDLLDAGTDGIKLYAATWAPPIVSLPQDAIEAAVREARRRGKPAFAHPSNRNGLLAAVRGGVDILVHTAPQSGRWDDVILEAMRASGVALIPTLKLWTYELRHDRISAQRRFLDTALGQLRAWLGAGGTVLFGTDVGYMDDYDPGEEYALMAEAGMDLRQILASLTTTPAERFGESKERGRVASGLAADLVVLGADPAGDVRSLAAVRYTLRDGRVIYRAKN